MKNPPIRRENPGNSNNLVRMENISVRFGKVVALNGVNFNVGGGEIVGLLGDNGAGKTTLIKTLIGLLKPDSGKIFFQGRQVSFNSPIQARIAGIETTYQDLALIDLLSVTRNFFLGREVKKKIGPFQFLDHKKMKSITEKYLYENGFTEKDIIHKVVNSLSGGERQKIAIGRANYFCAKLLILDEPTASLSETETEQVLNLVLRAKRRGTSVIFVTHNAHEVFEIADRFIILQNGKNLANLGKKDADLKEIEKLVISSRLAAVRQMAAGVAHQIRNPLGIMKVTAEMLKDDFEVADNREDYKRLTQLLINEIDSLNLTINNFLDFARPIKIKRKICSIGKIIQQSLLNIPMNKFKNIKLETEIEDKLDTVYLDNKLIEQVATNLLLNALEASPPGSTVKLRAYKSLQCIIIEAEDRGEGFNERKIKQIFSPFFTTKANGTGLGLSIAKRIVEQHGGSITAVSSPGNGSIFTVKLSQDINYKEIKREQ